MLKELKQEHGAGILPAPAPAAELEREFARLNAEYLSFLLDSLLWERRRGSKGGMETIERMINKEIDRWQLDEDREVFLAAILAERHGLELPEPQ
ncbi:MAG: hypothetical protein ACE5KR_00785 [Candidatus Bipolaricaulia bacterium]